MNPVDNTDQTMPNGQIHQASGVADGNPTTMGSLPAVDPQTQPIVSEKAASSAPLPISDPTMQNTAALPIAAQKISPHSPALADDVDLIEKEWVVKAKAIIKNTRDNPNEQTKEISKFKADYLKTRYSKDLKISE